MAVVPSAAAGNVSYADDGSGGGGNGTADGTVRTWGWVGGPWLGCTGASGITVLRWQ